MNLIDWINFDLIMDFIYIFSAVLFGWLIKSISTSKNLSKVIAGYILYLVLLMMLWIGWIPSASKKLVYASFLGLAIWVGVGIYKLIPNVIERERSRIHIGILFLIGVICWILFGWFSFFLILVLIFFSVFNLELGHLKITKGKFQFGVKEWKDYFRKEGINLIICLIFLLAVVALARADNLVLFLIGIVIILLGSIECGKKMVITPLGIVFYVIMTLLLIYFLTLFSELFLF